MIFDYREDTELTEKEFLCRHCRCRQTQKLPVLLFELPSGVINDFPVFCGRCQKPTMLSVPYNEKEIYDRAYEEMKKAFEDLD